MVVLLIKALLSHHVAFIKQCVYCRDKKHGGTLNKTGPTGTGKKKGFARTGNMMGSTGTKNKTGY